MMRADLRIAIAGFLHETNTYASPMTSAEDFEVWRGAEICDQFAGTATPVGGMLAGVEELGAVVVPLVHAWAEPGGTITDSAFLSLTEELLEAVRGALPLDLVALDLHGAGAAEGVDDVEGDLCRRVRELLPPETRLVAALDLHGNLTQSMADQLDLAIGYHEYPHVDQFERGVELVRLGARILAEGLEPRIHVESLPLLVGPGPLTCTTIPGPAATINELCRVLEQHPGILDCTFFHGFPQADVPFAGASIVAIDDGRDGSARAVAQEAAARLWELRRDFEHDLPSPREAVEAAMAAGEGPIVLNDVGDNPGGGAPGDCTRLLRALLEAGADDACLGVMYDPEAVDLARQAGPGATIALRLGGKRSAWRREPLDVEAYVKGLTDGRFLLEEIWQGVEVDMGTMARLRIQGVDVLVGSARIQVFDPEVFSLAGIDVKRRKLVCVKSAVHFRAGFARTAASIVSADGLGLSSADVGQFERARSERPLYPLDRETVYASAVAS
jgi:microcystin degradation protein MlrC